MTYIEKSRLANAKKYRRAEVILNTLFISGFIAQLIGLISIEDHTVVGGAIMLAGTLMIGFAGRYFEEDNN